AIRTFAALAVADRQNVLARLDRREIVRNGIHGREDFPQQRILSIERRGERIPLSLDPLGRSTAHARRKTRRTQQYETNFFHNGFKKFYDLACLDDKYKQYNDTSNARLQKTAPSRHPGGSRGFSGNFPEH